MEFTNPSSSERKSLWSRLTKGDCIRLLRRVWQWLTLVHSDDPVRYALNRGFASVIIGMILLGIPLSIVLVTTGEFSLLLGLILLPCCIISWWVNRSGTTLGVTLYVGLSVIATILAGPSEYIDAHTPVPLVLIIPIVFATLFIRPKAGLWTFLLLVTLLGIRLAMSNVPREYALRFMSIGTLNLAMITTLMMVGVSMFLRALRSSIAANEALHRLNDELEQRVSERTAVLTERTEQLEDQALKLTQATEAAEAANQAKSIFLANMSHELRTPLNSILGFTRLVANKQLLPQETLDDLGIVLRSGEHLHTLINQVLDLSRIEAGHITLTETDFDLHRLMDELVDMFAVTAQDKDLFLDFERATDVPRFVRADQVKLRQVLINLLSNAIKFTANGRVTLCVSQLPKTEESATNRRLLIAVKDTGPGIATEELNTLFGPFVQAEAGRRAKEGSGLGLAISRSFVRLMGGEIGLDSHIGQGTTISFDIPVRVVEAGVVALPTDDLNRCVVALAPGQPRYRILVADDLRIIRHLVVRLLVPLGFELREAVDGKEAIEIYEQWQPHLIFMDMRMPVMDGYESTRRIKASDRGQATRIIALTASSFAEERDDILVAGCDDLLRKPFHEADLFDLMNKHLGVRFIYSGETPTAAFGAPAIVNAEALAALPREMLRVLEQALLRLDTEAISSAITDIRTRDAGSGHTLATLAEDFQYGKMLRFIQSTEAEDFGEEPT